MISANTSEILSMNAEELKQSIKVSEGRVVLSENVATRETFVGDITNAEIAIVFGADGILLMILIKIAGYDRIKLENRSSFLRIAVFLHNEVQSTA